jgi:SSS family solute:Na+ symporter
VTHELPIGSDSLCKGYTVVGIPNEAFATGWNSLRWVATIFAFVFGYMGTSLRLRRAGLLRNHQSPTDFITDRYQSQFLRYTTLLLQLLPSIVYLAAQIVAIKSTFNSIFNLDPDTAYPVVLIMMSIVIFEWLGGLNSVAFTDTVQALIMVTCFIAIPCVMFRQFGGWQDLDAETYPKPQFFQTPTRQTQWKFWQFSLVNFAFFTLPHFLQRVYAAKDLKSMKYSFTVVTLAPWFTSLIPVFMGTIAVTFLVNADGTPQTPASPFAAILEALMDIGGFPKVIATIMVVASLAAIMSTADSILIAISQLVTAEIIYPLTPSATPSRMTWYGRAVSLLAAFFSLLIG